MKVEIRVTSESLSHSNKKSDEDVQTCQVIWSGYISSQKNLPASPCPPPDITLPNTSVGGFGRRPYALLSVIRTSMSIPWSEKKRKWKESIREHNPFFEMCCHQLSHEVERVGQGEWGLAWEGASEINEFYTLKTPALPWQKSRTLRLISALPDAGDRWSSLTSC